MLSGTTSSQGIIQEYQHKYNYFTALVNYLSPKVRAMRAWKGSSASSAEKQYASQCFSGLSIANQF